MKTIDDIDFRDKKVLMRIDTDIPIDKQGNIEDDIRLQLAMPSIKKVLKQCKQLILIGHRGRPKGKKDSQKTMDPVALWLSKHLSVNVKKLDDCVYDSLPSDKVILLENLRFHIEEEEANEDFAKKLASYADIFVNESFATLQNAHASNILLPKLLPSVMGYTVQKELGAFDFSTIKHPVIAVLGGSKLSTKMSVINNLVKQVDYLLLGGAMVFTFFKAQGLSIGKSLYEEDYLMNAKMLLHNEKIKLPDYIVVAKSAEEPETAITVFKDKIPEDMMGLDLGMESIEDFKPFLEKAKTIFWNGPLGYYEDPAFSKATNALSQFLAKSTAVTVLGGGDTGEAIDRLGLRNAYDHVSTGGGASLQLLAGNTLPALKALEESEVEFFH